MRNKKARALRKIAYQRAPKKESLVREILTKRLQMPNKVTDEGIEQGEIINVFTRIYEKGSPRHLYQQFKKVYNRTPRNKREGLLDAL